MAQQEVDRLCSIKVDSTQYMYSIHLLLSGVSEELPSQCKQYVAPVPLSLEKNSGTPLQRSWYRVIVYLVPSHL